MPWPRRVTHLLWAVSVVLVVLTVVAVRDLGDPAGAWIVGGTVLASGVPFAAGFLAVRHDPRNWVGPWLTAAGANILLQMAHGNWADALAALPSDLAASAELLNLTQGIWMGWFLPFAMVLLLFPDGRPNDVGSADGDRPSPLGGRVQPLPRGGAWAADAPWTTGRARSGSTGSATAPSPRWWCSTPACSLRRWRPVVATGPRPTSWNERGCGGCSSPA